MNGALLLTLATVTLQPAAFGWLESLIVALCIATTVLAYTVGVRARGPAGRTSLDPTAADLNLGRTSPRFGLLGVRTAAIVCLFLTLLHPAWIREQNVEAKPIIAVVLDDSLSMGVGATAPQLGHTAATTPYSRAATALRTDLLPALQPTHRVRLYDVLGRSLRPDNLPGVPAGARSPLTQTLLSVQRDLGDQPLAGIVLLSDGAELTDRPSTGGLEQLRVPVYPVDLTALGAAAPEPEVGRSAASDLAIEAVSTSRHALVGNTVRATVDVSADGDPGEAELPVSLLDGDQTVAAATLRWDLRGARTPAEPATGRPAQRCELEFAPRRPGEFAYMVVVGGLPGEVNLANNRQTFPLTVSERPLTVLYVDGVLRWEGKFIREALAADPGINVISSIRTVRPGADRGSQGLLLPDQLGSVDVVILGDVEATYFTTADELQALSTWVTERGGGLVLTGGYHSFGPAGFGRTALRNILPVEFSASANPQIEQPFNLRLTEAGREHAIFRLSGDPVRDTAFFHKLPPLDGCSRIAGIKPGAEVLAVNAQVAGSDREQGLPVLVVQQVGAGRTMVFAVDTTWRWRTIVGGFTGDSSFYGQFWGQLVRWMAREKEERPPTLLAVTDRPRYQVGETITLTIELRSASAAQRWTLAARALDERGGQMPVPLAELGDGHYRGTLAARQPGRLDLFARAEPRATPEANQPTSAAASDAQAQSQVVTVEIQRPDVELLSPHGDPQWLARTAQLTGGRSVAPGELRALAAQLPSTPVSTTVVRSSGTWGERLFGTTFVVLLCLEWILRRRSQLA